METGAFFIFRKEVFTKLGQRIGNNPFIYTIDQFEAIDIDIATTNIVVSLAPIMQAVNLPYI